MVFLDTNIILEITLKDRAKFQQVKSFLEKVDDTTAISMLSVHLIMHFGRKEKADDTYLEGIIDQNVLLALTPDDYQWAKSNEHRKDFENALQLAVAIRTGCETFVTLDQELAKAYAELPINIQTI
jgi:predicted nucleic acid-binding protein